MKSITSLVLAVILFLEPTVAMAATISTEFGKTYVNEGDGYNLIEGVRPLKGGSHVFVTAGASAIVNFSPKCAVRVRGPDIVLFALSPSCPGDRASISYKTMMQRGQVAQPSSTPPSPGARAETDLVVNGKVISARSAESAAIRIIERHNFLPAGP